MLKYIRTKQEACKINNLEEIFKAYDIRGKVNDQLNEKTVKQIAIAYGNWLPIKKTVAVGRDMRPDSYCLSRAFIEGLLETGIDVWDIGEVTSDMIYFAIGKWDLSGGAVITASHNPGKDNGIKLYRDRVTAVGLETGLDEIRDTVITKKIFPKALNKGIVSEKNITKEWVKHCLKFVTNIKPFHIAIDAGNGMAGAILPHILPSLPLKSTNMYFDLDGSFPNHEANPQKIENLNDLITIIKNNNLDFGIAFDGDGDRAVLVDDLGRSVLGTDLITIMAKHYLLKYPHSKIVHDVRTSRATEELIREWGGQPIKTKAGRVNVGAKMREVNAPFGGETSGHLFFKENYDADSGLITALLAMQAISDSNKKLSELINEYRRYSMTPEINIETSLRKNIVFDNLKTVFKDDDFEEIDGLTVHAKDYWFNIRASNTEPVMRLNAEASNKDQLEMLIKKIMDTFKK